MFRQQAGLSPGLDWSQLNSSLFAVTFLAQQNGRGKTCRFCLETDHSDEECALAPGAPQVQQPSSLQGIPLLPLRTGVIHLCQLGHPSDHTQSRGPNYLLIVFRNRAGHSGVAAPSSGQKN